MKLAAVFNGARKTVIALTAAAAQAAALGLLHGSAEKYVSGGLAVLAAGLVYLVPNSQKEAPVTP